LALAEIETFIEKGFKKLNKSETEKLKQLSVAVERFENEKYPMPVETDIIKILEQYMFENRITKSQLSRQLEIPNSTLSEIMNRKKKINLAIAKKLHLKLHIDGNFLLQVA
jgi:HTH-type transcriptional regulator/antitoxin HigA